MQERATTFLTEGGGDKRAIFTAAAHAQRATDYLHGLQPVIDEADEAAA